MTDEPQTLENYSIKMNENYPYAFCVVKVECDENDTPNDGIFLYCNNALAKLYGMSKEQIAGHRYFEILPEGGLKWLKSCYEAAYIAKVLDEIFAERWKYSEQ